MKTLRNFEVAGAIYLGDGVTEAKVGDQVKLYLDQDAIPGLPEYVLGTIQHPVVKVDCGSKTSYSIEYDEADLDGFLESLRPDDITNWESVSAVDVLSDALAAETAARVAADELLVPKTTTVNGKALSGNITLVTADFSDATSDVITSGGATLLKSDVNGHLRLNLLSSRVFRVEDSSSTFGAELSTGSTLTYDRYISPPDADGYLVLCGNTKGVADVLEATLPPIFPIYTLASMPLPEDFPGGRAYVSDSNATLAAGHGNLVTGGGSNFVPVYSDGTNWRIG